MASTSEPAPATAFLNAAVFDGERYLGARAEPVVVREGRITTENELPPGVEVVDVAGGLLAPGFVDAHVHTVQGGMELTRCNLAEGRTREDYLATIAAYAASHPDVPWILGGGWAMAAFPGGTPTAADLDAVCPDRPVFLPNRDHHGAWVNSRAMEIAGIRADSPDPEHGRLERDEHGHPTGTLHEGAMGLVTTHLPVPTDAELYDGLLAGQAYLHSQGVTAWQDAIIGSGSGMDDIGPTYAEAAARGDLTGWVVGALWWEREQGEEQVESLLERRRELTGGRFRATSVKIMQDGVAENFTAAMSAPYLDRCGHATANAGHSFVDPARLGQHVTRLDAEGFQVHVHAIGDRGVREALDAFVGVSTGSTGGADRRHHIAHLQVVHPDDVARFAQLGVAANVQSLWACLDDQMVDLTIPFLGPERSAWQYPFGSLHRAGARLVAGSDWPVSTPNPLEAIHVAVNRWAHGASGREGSEAFLPDEALALETAFAAYTSGSSWVNHRDDAGRIAPGHVADLVVLDRDPFAGPPSDIGAAQVVSTWVSGVAVHRAD